MPILRYGNRKLYFAHIPKAAGTSFYSLLLANHWQIANLGRINGEFGEGGTYEELREIYGITCLQKEGDFSKAEGSLQHVDHAVWSSWGPFDSSIALIRAPLSRFKSAYTYHYRSALNESGATHGESVLAEFHEIMTPFLQQELPKVPHAFDGHYRPTEAFLAPDTKPYLIEHDGLARIKNNLNLKGEFPHSNVSQLSITIPSHILECMREYYSKDIEWYEKQVSEPKQVT